MAKVLDVLQYPNPVLREVAQPIETIDDAVREMSQDMLATMYADGGIGLAANQVGWLKRMVVIDVSEEGQAKAPRVFVNPEILEKSGETESSEGCLSIPGVQEKIKRAERVKARWLDLDGKTVEMDMDGVLAICLQHELDHLNGKLFIDYLSPFKRDRAEKAIKRAKLEAKRRQEEAVPGGVEP